MAPTTLTRLAEDDGYITIPQAMRMLGVGRSRLLALVIRGELKANQVAGQLFIDRASIAEYDISAVVNCVD